MKAKKETARNTNPAVGGGDSYKRNGQPEYITDRPQHRRKLPDFIQGDDLKICNYIRERYSYAKIAEIMSMTEAAVTLRIARMRKTIEEMKAAGVKVVRLRGQDDLKCPVPASRALLWSNYFHYFRFILTSKTGFGLFQPFIMY